MEYPRDLPAGYTPGQLALTEDHVRLHLASVADPNDDPGPRLDDVVLVHRALPGGGLRVVGFLDAAPTAPYLRPGFDPDAEERPGWLVWTPADQPGWDPYQADPVLPAHAGQV